MKNVLKKLCAATCAIAFAAVIVLSMAACNGGGGGPSSPTTTPGSSGSGELWQKLVIGNGWWINDDETVTLNFTDRGEAADEGAYKLNCSVTPNTYGVNRAYVKLNSASGTWYGNLPASANISFSGGSSDTATITFSTATAMTISNGKGAASGLNGSYTKWD